MKILGERMRSLRASIKLSQVKIAEMVGTSQVSINRYESANGDPPLETILWYADYFDVSLDYLFGRTDEPQGKLYEFHPRIAENSPEMRHFIDMCFDPNSPMNGRLKQTLIEMLGEVKKHE